MSPMIVFDLVCVAQHRFEGWFRSSDDFENQRQGAMIECPSCGHSAVSKAPMAPAVPAKANRISGSAAPIAPITVGQVSCQQPPAPDIVSAPTNLAAAQAQALSNSKWVGDDFAARSRAMYYGEAAEERIHGRATREEAMSLIEEGVTVLPLIVPLVPPEEAN